ncbi:MAG: discoidin domain-containing protein, partial [Planctomycetaceae bacterium]
MKSSIRWIVAVNLVLGMVSAQTGLGQTEPRLVAEEFLEKLSQVAERSLRPPEALDFPPHQARFVRIAILETSGSSQPGIDELEIYGPDSSENLALAQRGSVASASSVLPGYPIHQIQHLNDGRYGNDYSWIAAAREDQWVQIELPEAAEVARVIITRDRTGRYTDRIPEAFEVLVSQDGRQWQSVARRDRTGAHRARRLPYLPVDRLPEPSWDGFLHYTFLRERATWSSIPADDHLSPLVTDRSAVPGGEPYWGRLARLVPLERVMVLFEELTDRLVAKGLDV